MAMCQGRHIIIIIIITLFKECLQNW